MRRSVWAILAGLVLAILGAAAVAKSFGLPLADYVAGERPIWHLLRTALPVAAFALPAALTAILMSETWRVRGPLFWISVGALVALLAHITLTSGDAASASQFATTRSFNTLMGMGLVGGLIYWMVGGRGAGRLAAAIERAGRATELDERGLRKRCRGCTIAALALGLLPLGLLGWHLTGKSSLISPTEIVARTAAEGSKRLAEEGLPALKFVVEDHIGRVTGTMPDDTQRMAAFNKAKSVLDPIVGLPGVVAYLQNDIAVAEPPKAVAPAVPPAAEVSKLKPADELKLAVEAKKKADEAAAKSKEAAAKRKAEEEARGAAEAKRKADEAAAKAKAEEEARVAAETKRKADEAAAKAKAEEEARVAAETKRKADEAAAKAKAEEEARVAAETKRKADEAAAKAAEPAKVAAAASAPLPAVPPAAATPASRPLPDAKCVADFADTQRSTSIRFAFGGAKFDEAATKAIERYASVADRCRNFGLTIRGHSDINGPAAVNLTVSEARANAVRDALVSRGISVDRLKAEGYGAERPFDNSRNKLAYSRNRRVEIVVGDLPAAALTAVAPPTATTRTVPPLPTDQCAGEFSRAFTSETIKFIGSSAIVADSYADILDRIADLALACPSHTIAINGHTDRRGSAAYNAKLSVERAQAVRDALIDRDVPAARLTANGYGGERPFDPANSPSAYAQNRRVDFGAAIPAQKSQ